MLPRTFHVVPSILALLIFHAPHAQAGLNAGVTAELSWGATSLLTNTTPAATNKLFIRFKRNAPLSFKGGEIDLTWSPASDFQGCFDHIGTIPKTSAGTTCTYLNRGSAVPVATIDDEHHLHYLWSNTIAQTSCTAGTALEVDFETDMCPGAGAGCFSLNAATITDALGGSDAAEVTNWIVTVSGGVDPCPASNRPTIQAIPEQFASEGETFVLLPNATDPHGYSLAWSGSSLPSGATVDSQTGELTWTPTFEQAGSYAGVRLQADNGQIGGSASVTFTITVNDVDRAPIMSPIPNQRIAELQTLVVTPTASDPDGDVLYFTGSQLPIGASVNSTTGVLTWRPEAGQAGMYNGVAITADDQREATARRTFSITVDQGPTTPVENPGVHAPAGFAIVTATQAASNGSIEATIAIPSPTRIQATLLDMRGGRVASLGTREAQPGIGRYEWRLPNDGLPVARGTYVLSVRAGTEERHARVVLLR